MVYKSSSPTKDGRCWQFRVWYLDPNGTRKQFNSKKYETKKEAQREEALYTLGFKKDSSLVKLGEAKELYLQYVKNNVVRNTYRSYATALTYFDKYNNIQLKDFGVSQYNDFLQSHSNLATRTLNLNIKVLRQVMVFASEQLNIDTLRQLKILKTLKVPYVDKLKLYTQEQYEAIIKDSKYPVLFTTLFYCGLRLGEARGLQWSDINFNDNTISISKQISSRESVYSPTRQTKSPTSTRTLPMFVDVANSLKTLYSKCFESNSNFNNGWYVFGTYKAFCSKLVEEDLKACCEKNGIEYLGCHAFRHSCASNMLNNGASVYLVSRYLGHSSIDITTRIYGHLLPNTLQELVNFIEKNTSPE